MRALWIALLIALLPLRGWVGDAMALGMIQGTGGPQVHAASTGEPCPHGGQAAPTQQAHGMQTGLHGDGAHEGAGAHDHLACDLCNGPALQAASAGIPGEQLAPGPQVLRAERFASLAPRHHHKPPIA